MNLSNEVVQRLKTSKDWEAFERYLKEHIISLDTVNGIKGTEKAIAIEIAARQHSIQKLIEILRPFMEVQQRPDTKGLAEEAARDAGL